MEKILKFIIYNIERKLIILTLHNHPINPINTISIKTKIKSGNLSFQNIIQPQQQPLKQCDVRKLNRKILA